MYSNHLFSETTLRMEDAVSWKRMDDAVSWKREKMEEDRDTECSTPTVGESDNIMRSQTLHTMGDG